MRRKFAVLASLAALTGLTSMGCDYYPLSSNRDYRFFQIKVTGVAAMAHQTIHEPGLGQVTRLVPTTLPLAVTDTMRIGFYAVIGGDSRYEYSHLDTTSFEFAGYRVRLWGKQDIRPDIIYRPSVEEMYGYPLLVFEPPLRVGTWIFLVSQPDGSVLRKEVVVQQ